MHRGNVIWDSPLMFLTPPKYHEGRKKKYFCELEINKQNDDCILII
jgi:hypothetical protein